MEISIYNSYLQEENYCPISFLSTPSKVFERLVHDAVYPHIRQLILPKQHDFVKRRSTYTNLMTFIAYIFTNMYKQVQFDAAYTDFKRTFHKVDHSQLLDKIAFYYIRGNLLRWFMSYIFNKTQRVVMNGHYSDSIMTSSGVLQGSILGPSLFIIFDNDITLKFYYFTFHVLSTLSSLCTLMILKFISHAKIYKIISSV